tara:strand:+ start:483 stop:1112 length:630 start_codon:yes stop_codon:yes gene_type:complete
MRTRAFTLVEITVVISLVIIVMGVTIYKFKAERREQAQQISRVDKQSNIRRFLMWFRQDMQSMDEIIQFRVLNSFEPEKDSRVVEVKFDRFVDEFDKQVVTYLYDFNRRKILRVVEEPSSGSNGRRGVNLDNVLNFQMIPYDYDGQRISKLASMRDNLYYFEARLLFSDHYGQEKANSIRPFLVKIYPKLKSSANKAGFNSFYINRRFD